MPGSIPRFVTVSLAAIAAGVTTALVFVLRAGGEGATNWPANWELRSSDNGVLFQLLQDVTAGRPLDWSFSPQVYVFPELPISALAFAVAGGDLYRYYLFVAVLNNVLLFLALYLVVRLLFRGEWLARASLAFLPLVALPLVGTTWLFSYHLAPTYYFGMYLLLVAVPAVFLVRTPWARAMLGAAIVLTAASNPLALVFAFPAFAAVLVLHANRSGWRSLGRPALLAGGILVATFLVRLVLSPLQGASPLAYVNGEIFAGRLANFPPYVEALWADVPTRVVLVIAALAALAVLAGAVVATVTLLRRRGETRELLVAVWFGLVPLGGLAGTAVLFITHTLYLWPVLVLPLVLVLLPLPPRWAPRALAIGVVGTLVLALFSGLPGTLGHPERYFGFRNDETRCLDESLPAGSEIGYATFSDARRLALPSARGIRLIPLKTDGSQAGWLANLDYLRADTGRFFFVNERGDEPAIDGGFITGTFGEPDQRLDCGDGRSIWLYTDDAKLDAIGAHFGTRDR
ncbi:hypothetical protein EYE40_05150 [Glaciihabitans arcticus]|uniref:Glycosyltransferase RgtA/B/C/D-like domain-containing protein n=1 Tax=Glaciihabitans arcticus TaxID=2668039 RepID=A0A4Q9GRU7_9MICO|nr:hypothetical protein [Glaciihabitans arcticus]TBN56834.1 hypothetical protein EYE40_05150 [Glaciihabitans arcticus]